MIKIASTSPKKDDNRKVKSKKKSHSVKQKSSSFDLALENNITFNFQGSIDELLTELKEEEGLFLKKQTEYELNRYKAIIQKILKKIMDEGMDTRTIRRLRRDKADFIIIDKINSKLLDIAAEITKKTNKAFNLFRSIEEIRGLIFDLIH